MLFNSYAFLFEFLPPTIFIFFLLGRWHPELARLWLVAASLIFYAGWSLNYIWLITGSILFNYTVGLAIDAVRAKGHARLTRWTLAGGVTGNLALLGYYKYADFFISNLDAVMGSEFTLLHLALPLGISFFTFTQIAFLVDAARGEANERGLIRYALFVTYFPHLLAGPIIHHKAVMPQFRHPSTFKPSAEMISLGIGILTIGLAKKVLVADGFVATVHDVFAPHTVPLLYDAWVGALAYTLQLYFDFSGYSDMAIGLSLLIGVHLPINFNSPYKAINIIDFWRRWHMTLSQFLRDYLYIPLGGNRHGTARRYINLYLTMLLGGLWHGAGWTFVIWGGLHGFYLVVNHGWRKFVADTAPPLWRQFVYGAITLLCVIVGWVFFRAPDLTTALSMLSGLVGGHGVILDGKLSSVGIDRDMQWKIPLAFLIIFLLPNSQEIMGIAQSESSATTKEGQAKSNWFAPAQWRWRATSWSGVLTGLVFFACLLKLREVSEFIYYQF